MNSIAYTPSTNKPLISGYSNSNTPESVFSGRVVIEKGIIVNGRDLLEIIYGLQKRINKLETRIIKEELCNVLSADTIKIVLSYIEE